MILVCRLLASFDCALLNSPADLDYFCLSIQRDLHQITAVRSSPKLCCLYLIIYSTRILIHEILYSPRCTIIIFTVIRILILPYRNQPLAPSDRRSARDLVESSSKGYPTSGELGLAGIRKTLVAGWREVDNFTREGLKRE